MALRNKKKEKAAKEAELEAAALSGDTPEQGLGESQAAKEPESELETALREREEFKERWQRAAADYQNLKRRQITDIEAAVRRAQTPLLEESLIVLDYLDMALSTPVSEPEAKNLMVGVEMTRGQFMGVLERHDIKLIEVAGAFDPALHQAVGTVETEEHEAGTILETTRTGWTYRGQVLRPAQVKVATSPTKDGEGEESDNSEAPDSSTEA